MIERIPYTLSSLKWHPGIHSLLSHSRNSLSSLLTFPRCKFNRIFIAMKSLGRDTGVKTRQKRHPALYCSSVAAVIFHRHWHSDVITDIDWGEADTEYDVRFGFALVDVLGEDLAEAVDKLDNFALFQWSWIEDDQKDQQEIQWLYKAGAFPISQ